MNEREQLEQAISALEGQRSTLGNTVVDIALEVMREKLASLQSRSNRSNEIQQRKQITVLFADVSGFTALAETMDHEEVSGFIDSLWSRLDKAITDQGGYIDKHIGDAVMALFGAPIAHEDDPERAIRAALAVQKEIVNWKKDFADPKSPAHKIQMRIGVNTGPALIGEVGTTREYTAIGDTVNLASRLEHAAPLGGVLISHDSYRHVKGIFDVTKLEPVTVKGKAEPVQVYLARGIRPRSFRMTTRGVEGIETRTIGRELELEKMQASLEKTASERKTHLVTIVAEAGTGKSRLLYEFIKWLEFQPRPVRLFKGRATLEMAKLPYALIRDLLSTNFEIQDSDRASIARQKLESGMIEYSGGNEEAIKHAHFIGHLIGFDFSTSPHLQGILGDARQIRDLALHYTAQFFANSTAENVSVILLEDIHWADGDSLDLIEYLMNAQPDLPLMIICLTRPTLFEQRPDWGKTTVQNLSISLQPLSDQDSRRLVTEILRKVPAIPDELMELIITRAEGSPFYIEELIKLLIEGDVIVAKTEQWEVKMDHLASLKVPPTLTGLLQARLDSLSAGDREILQQASIVGRVFWTNVVEHMHNPESQAGEETDIVNQSFGTLRKKELIFNHEESAFAETPEYIFKHAMLHDVTYESVLLRLRRVYHAQAAEGLIWLSGERVNEFAGRIGEHFEKAGDSINATEWYARAGRRAQDAYAPVSAIGYYQKVLGFLKENPAKKQLDLEIEVCEQLGEVLNWQARYSEAVETYKRMRDLAEEAGNQTKLSRALQGIAISIGYIGDHRATLENAIVAEKTARQADARIELARALWTQGLARYRLGEAQMTLSISEQALSIATELNDRNEMARCLNLMGAALYATGQYPQAETQWESSLAIFQELGNRRLGMDLLSNLGVIADARGDYETAFQRYHSALEIAREVGYRDGEIVFLTNRGGELVALKNHNAAETDLLKAIELAGTNGSWCLPNTYYYLAEAKLGMNKINEALDAAHQSLTLSKADGAPENIGAAWRMLGMISASMITSSSQEKLQEPVSQSPESCFSESANILARAGMDGERARTLREWAKYELKRGDKERGTSLWNEAREIFEKLGAQMEVDRMTELPS